MQGFKSDLDRRAFEVGYAFLRLAPSLADRNVAGYLEQWALALIPAAIARDQNQIDLSVSTLERLTQIAVEIGSISLVNGQILFRELAQIKEASDQIAAEREVNLESIFSTRDISAESAQAAANAARKAHIKIEESSDEEESKDSYIKPEIRQTLDSAIEMDRNIADKEEPAFSGREISLASRQEAILGLIRQKPNCRLRDIMEVLPGVSERTIRYDLQRLIEQGLVDRVGESGPSTYYRVPEEDMAEDAIELPEVTEV